ncbi:MAG: EAL domain-containing protein [Pelosinus sp.]|nr:EAL domain-containing protein [Pelosinus sp.]
MLDYAQVDTNLAWLLKHKAVQTYFQPIVSIRKHALIGLEALSRGLDSNNDIIMPQTLFAKAAASGRSVELDRLCRNTALKNYKNILAQNNDSFLFLNLDTSILDKGVVGSGHLIRAVRNLGLSPSSIVIEIIESKVNDIKSLTKFIRNYKQYGFLIALDDMGSASSNLDRILQARPDIIKIDRGLIKEINKDYYKQELFRALVLVAKKIGALVVAEGVETHGEAITSLELGADFLQGYLIAAPAPYASIEKGAITKTLHSLVSSYRNSIVEKVRNETLQKNMYKRILAVLAEKLSIISPENFEPALKEIAQKHPAVHCYYILDKSGIQITETIKADFAASGKSHGMFRPDFKGCDQSLKDYFIFIHAGADSYISEPYLSLANGHSCITGSILFTTDNGCYYILCIDFNL